MVMVFSTCTLDFDLRAALGVLEPREEIEGIDLELRLADLELWRLGVLGASEIDRISLGEPSLSQKVSGASSVLLTSSLLSREFWGEDELYLCFLFKTGFGDGVDLGDLGLTSFPIAASPATSKAEMAALVDVLALVSTYMSALICWLNVSAWSELMGALPCFERLAKMSLSFLRSACVPTRIMGVAGATDLTSGHQWFMALKSDEGSVIL